MGTVIPVTSQHCQGKRNQSSLAKQKSYRWQHFVTVTNTQELAKEHEVPQIAKDRKMGIYQQRELALKSGGLAVGETFLRDGESQDV